MANFTYVRIELCDPGIVTCFLYSENRDGTINSFRSHRSILSVS